MNPFGGLLHEKRHETVIDDISERGVSAVEKLIATGLASWLTTQKPRYKKGVARP
jgi:hypothetical protein